MSFNGSAIKALLDGAVSKGSVHGIAAVVVDRSGLLFHHAAGEAGERTMFRNASMTKAVATTAALQLVEQGRLSLDATIGRSCRSSGSCRCWMASTATSRACGLLRARPRCAS